jgi:predicted nuclease with TOPRIM domain
MSSELIAGLSTLATALVSAVAAAVVLVLNARSGTRARETSDKQNEYEKLLGRYEKDIQRREAHEDQLTEVAAKLTESNARLREQLAAWSSRYDLLYSYLRRQYDYMKNQGLDPEPPPMSPAPSSPTSIAEREGITASGSDLTIAVKKSQQTSEILKRTRPRPSESIKEEARKLPDGPEPSDAAVPKASSLGESIHENPGD